MKNLAINKTNNILSRIREGFEGFLSIFDGNKYTASEVEVALPEALTRSLESIEGRAERYQKQGIIDLAQTNTTPEYTTLKTPQIQPKKTYEKPTVDINKDRELEL